MVDVPVKNVLQNSSKPGLGHVSYFEAVIVQALGPYEEYCSTNFVN